MNRVMLSNIYGIMNMSTIAIVTD